MKANELMFGNYVYSNATDRTHSVMGISKEYVSLNCITFDYSSYEEIEPIPLTKTWFIHFGFTKEGTDFWNLNDFEIADLGNGKWVNCVNANKYINGEPFLYVHQLQNLYFALTGIELTY